MNSLINFGNAPEVYANIYQNVFVVDGYSIEIEYHVNYPLYPSHKRISHPEIIITHAFAVDKDDGEWPILDFTDVLEYSGKTDEELYDMLIEHFHDESLTRYEQAQDFQ